jgi:uncharacterized protein
MLHVQPEDKAELITILIPVKQYDIQAYGSRVKGTHREFSDLDLCFMQEMPWEILDDLREKFTESNLPFFVTIVPWSKLNSEFQKLIQKDLLPFDQW